MGTSTSQRSPSTTNWSIVGSVLGRPDVPLERQAAELWRAASSDPQVRLAERLSSEVLVAASHLAESRDAPAVVGESYDRLVAETKAADVFSDIGRRALVRAVIGGGGVERFAQELFAETASYYVSRDLASYVAAPGRVASTEAAIALKRAIIIHTKQAVAARPHLDVTPRVWSQHVAGAIGRLTESGSRRRGR